MNANVYDRPRPRKHHVPRLCTRVGGNVNCVTTADGSFSATTVAAAGMPSVWKSSL